ncbi:hypothetical protein J6590_073975 [Homalodisca vitripennis]|nr:hypothetical protein J6590_073975 [Homalodisca vitripennis]
MYAPTPWWATCSRSNRNSRDILQLCSKVFEQGSTTVGRMKRLSKRWREQRTLTDQGDGRMGGMGEQGEMNFHLTQFFTDEGNFGRIPGLVRYPVAASRT